MFAIFTNLCKSTVSKCSNRFAHKYMFNMDKAYLRHFNESDQFEITFRYRNPENNLDRQFNFCRQINESVSVFSGRVAANVEKVLNKKRKKKNLTENKDDIVVKVELILNGTIVDGDTICKDLFGSNADKEIVINLLDKRYTIIKNAPWVDGITLPKCIMANFPVYPSKFETVFTDKHLSEFVWYRSGNKTDWELGGSGFVYLPENRDINSYLKLNCTPKNEQTVGPAVEVMSEVKVEASPGFCPFEIRHQFTKHRAVGKEFRVVSYNILADLYCDSDFSRTSLFPYCPPYALHIDYRKQLIIKELLGFNADIICLQELDKKVCVNDIEPVFNSLNYSTIFQLKGGLVAEGLACIFNSNRFKLLESNCIVIGEEMKNNPLFSDIWEKVSQNEKLSERILPRTTVLQTNALESLEHDEILLVANTHLYFHPDADHIRLLQGGIIIRYIKDIMEKLSLKCNKRISVTFCGDFNSTPECGIYQLFTTGFVSDNCVDWESNKEEAVKNVSLSQPIPLASACGTPEFTNYTAGFSGCLDYIFYDKTKLEVVQVVPLPSIEDLKEHIALPSVVFPSDHISLVSDLKWL